MQKRIQEKYRKIKRENREEKTTGKKETIIVAFAVFLIIILNSLIKEF
ncbi:hypothetical protein [Bacillus benzoevorans]